MSQGDDAIKEPFGEFARLSMDENRILLGGSASGAPGNQGNYLSPEELKDLNNCLKASRMNIH
jgi:hypothetical protein